MTLAARPQTTATAIEAWLDDRAIAPLLAAHRVLPATPPRHAPWPEGLTPRLADALRRRGISALYTHQAQAFARRNRHVGTREQRRAAEGEVDVLQGEEGWCHGPRF